MVISLSPTLQSQTLVKENNLWSNLVEVSPNTFTFHYQKIHGDTTIDAKSYKKLLGTTSNQLNSWSYEAALREPQPGKIYSRKKGSTNEHLLYDFNIAVNDTFTGYYNNCEYKMKLNSVENIYLMNGEVQKQYHFSGTGLSGFFTENWINGIGSDNGLTSAGIYSCTVVSDTAPTLNCFTEDAIVKVYNNADYPCYSLVGITENPESVSPQVIPNPVIDVATIHLQEAKSKDLNLSVSNSHGQEVAQFFSKKGNQLVFNRKGLTAGIYFYKVYSGADQIANGKFVVQ